MAGWLLFSVLWQFENSMFSLHCHGFHPLLGLDGVCDMEVCLWGHASHQGPSRNFHGSVVWNRSAWCTITDKTVKLFHLEENRSESPSLPFPSAWGVINSQTHTSSLRFSHLLRGQSPPALPLSWISGSVPLGFPPRVLLVPFHRKMTVPPPPPANYSILLLGFCISKSLPQKRFTHDK